MLVFVMYQILEINKGCFQKREYYLINIVCYIRWKAVGDEGLVVRACLVGLGWVGQVYFRLLYRQCVVIVGEKSFRKLFVWIVISDTFRVFDVNRGILRNVCFGFWFLKIWL